MAQLLRKDQFLFRPWLRHLQILSNLLQKVEIQIKLKNIKPYTSAATLTLTILSGFAGGSPLTISSTRSIPSITRP